jgi:hypothetical protein
VEPAASFIDALQAFYPDFLPFTAFLLHDTKPVIPVLKGGLTPRTETDVSALNKKYRDSHCKSACNLLK